jgi:hypothetical protein
VPFKVNLRQYILEMSLLKRNRRGNYENGASNADTFWFGVLRGGGARGGAGAGGSGSGSGGGAGAEVGLYKLNSVDP